MNPSITGEIRPKSAFLPALNLATTILRMGVSMVDKASQVFRAFRIKPQAYYSRLELLVKEFRLPKRQAEQLLGESRAILAKNLVFKLAEFPGSIFAVVSPNNPAFCHAAECPAGQAFNSEQDGEGWIDARDDGAWLVLACQEPVTLIAGN
ncbi:hypothetical protein [Methylomagnum sp.]